MRISDWSSDVCSSDLLPAAIDDLAFDRLDRDRRVIDVERAARLAWRGADPAGELRKIVGGMQRIQRHLPVVGIDQMVPVRDHVVHRTAVMAERNAAVNAARRLILQDRKSDVWGTSG